MQLEIVLGLLLSLCGARYSIVVQIDDCNTSISYVNHSLPERPEFYRSIHLQKAHLVGENLGTVVFCMIHEIYLELKYLESKLQEPMEDPYCSGPCKRSETMETKRGKMNRKNQRQWSNSRAATLLKVLRMDSFAKNLHRRPLS
ncbi:uncharacterized protein LOC125677131 [Ostrea edulis]|uniref:uncharacterized protein LOC125677131 n=1 Tax=Ostrea edulis TaxID=37623 RepID=UPI0020949A27|nr:uncharacterized protein LOC125677131 [Ostrea edulis]